MKRWVRFKKISNQYINSEKYIEKNKKVNWYYKSTNLKSILNCMILCLLRMNPDLKLMLNSWT